MGLGGRTHLLRLAIFLCIIAACNLIPACSGQSAGAGGGVIRDPRRTFIIASILDEPYLMYRKREGNESKPLIGNDVYEGFAKDLAESLSARLNFSYIFDVRSTTKYGHRFRDGSWNGIIDLLQRAPGDRSPQISIAALTITKARAEVVSFSSPFLEFQYALLMKKPAVDVDTDHEVGGYKEPHVVYKVGGEEEDEDEEEDDDGEAESHYIFLRPMAPPLWGVFIGSVVLTVLLIFVVEKIISQKWSQAQEEVINRERAADSKVTILPKPVGLCTNGIIGSPRTTAGRFLQIIFWVYIAIFVAAYIATFSADRIVDELNDEAEEDFDPQSLEPKINTMKELAAQSDIQFAVLRGGSTHDYFSHTANPIYRKAHSIMNSNEIIIRNISEGVRRVRDSNSSFVFIMEEPTARAIAAHPPCDLIVSSELFGPKRGYGIAMSKSLNEDFVRSINLEILDMKENEELEALEKKWFHDRNRCTRKRRALPTPEAQTAENEGDDEKDDDEESSAENEAEPVGKMNNGDDDGDDKVPDDDPDNALCIKEMAGIFFILAAMLILSLLVAAVEICCASRNAIANNPGRDEDKEIELQPHQRQQQQRPLPR